MKKIERHSFSIVMLILIAFLFSLVAINFSDNNRLVLEREIVLSDVCPPFYLFTEDGDTINPVTGKNTDKPYSPRQTCGKCHDYDKITQAYHFQQGRDEEMPETYAERYQWALHPGNYGGNWCSPAPLYTYLSNKHNDDDKLMDMTSFTFLAGACGSCHPGGGPAEFDRLGNRYDTHMLEKGMESGGINNYDGDYYKARWVESGVSEGDCMMCHMPGYNHEKRNNNRASLNFRWMATAGSGWAEVSGSVSENEPVKVKYDMKHFDSDGRVSPHIIREPRNEACLACHAQPGWKKRGANFSPRTDVHLRANMKCVDCHRAGSMAFDERINSREMHEIGKGDDPGGKVRDDLDNTVLSCASCHDSGFMGAPIAKHNWLPSLHLDRISCQTCHIPERFVQPSQFQASDVFNPGTKIPTRGKHLWVFYGPDMKYYNHYGNMEMMGYDDKPTDMFKPTLINYNGMIYPGNRIHSAWPGIEIEGRKGLMQPRMRDIYNMWQEHFKDSTKYPELLLITDDNNDGIIEVNRPEEIDALILAVSNMLNDIEYPMDGKRVVWVYNNRVYTSGNEYYIIEKEIWEASPYANVHKYNHDVLPARSAIGYRSCTECHSLNSDFFYGPVLKYPFDEDGNPVYEPQYLSLGMNSFVVWLSCIREQYLKTAEYALVLFLILMLGMSILISQNKRKNYVELSFIHAAAIYLLVAAGLLFVYFKPDVNSHILPDRMLLEKNHFLLSMVPFITGIILLIINNKVDRIGSAISATLFVFILLAAISGFFIVIKFEAIKIVVLFSYTLFDVAVIGITITSIIKLMKTHRKILTSEEKTTLH